jgi:inner membrane protein
MLVRTHLAFAFLVSMLLYPILNPSNIYQFFAFIILGSLIVDIDHPQSKIGTKLKPISKFISFLFGHRTWFHSIFLALIISGILYYFNTQMGTALFIGYLSHIFLDGFTWSGVNIIHPINQLRIQGFVKTGKLAEHILLIIIIVLIVINIL